MKRTSYWPLALVVLLLAGCTEQPGFAPKGHCAVGPPPKRAAGFALEPAFEHAGLEGEDAHRLIELVASPWVAGEWYLVRQHGTIVRFHEDPTVEGHEVVFDVEGDPRLLTGPEEGGLGGLAFHPTRREAYIVYTAPTDVPNNELESRLSRFRVRQDGTLDEGSEELLLNLPQPKPAHSGDHVLFGPDGYLYYSSGDGGRPADGAGHGQDPFTLYGVMMRLDVDRDDPERGTPYAIPPDNPFADGVDGAPEVYAYGFRNPWRFSFDRDTGALWLGDVGENDWEEINRVEAGGNYGWSVLEGFECFGEDACDEDGLSPPVLAYDHDDGISVIGGFVYRGGDVPALDGRYLFADYIFGNVWSIDAEAQPGDAPEMRLEATAPFWISSFAESPNGELYLVNFTFGDSDRPQEGKGGLFRVVPAEPEDADDFPTRLSETGCLDMASPKTPATGMTAYTPRAKLWSDAADKDRFFWLPEGGRIEIDEAGDFVFPDESILVKSFRYGDQLHETRLLVKHEEVGWRGYSYRWNEAQTEAELLPGGKNETLPNGTYWRYPSRTQCDFCHSKAAGFTLGLEASQLDFARQDAADTSRNQLAAMHDQERFDEDLDIERLQAFDDVANPFGDESLDARARSYLHANCANCHRPSGPTRAKFDLRFSTALADTKLCDEPPTLGTLGGDEEMRRLIAPGDPDNSVLLLRMQSEGGPRMPPLGTNVVHEEATSLVHDWIESLDGCD